MIVLSHLGRQMRRITGIVVIAALLVVAQLGPVFAQATTGTLSGTVSAQEGGKLAGVTVTAVSPSQRYSARTNAQGFYALTGVVADTYTIGFAINGYETLSVAGITVAAGQATTLDETLARRLQTIGRVSSHSVASAFQPQQTQDTYTVSTQQINTILGKQNGTNEAALLAAIPGASYDSSGYPVLRGGRENEEGFQFEGIPYTDPFTNQFVNSLALNGAAQFQVTPGAGDASNGNAGTGAINIVAKRGTFPAFGSGEFDLYTNRSERDTHAEYGAATPSSRISNYASFYGSRISSFQYGAVGTPGELIGRTFSRNNQWTNDFVDNAVYRFGKDNGQSLQFFYENTQFDLHEGYAFQNGPHGMNLNGQVLYYKDNDPLFLRNAELNTGLTKAQIQAVMPFTIGQVGLTQQIGSRFPVNYNQPNETFKLQYANNINASTYLTMKYFEVNNVELFDFPYNSTGIDPGDFASLQGGWVRGVTLDLTKQLNAKHLLGFGAEYRFLHPVFSQPSASGGLFNVAGFGNGFEVADFLSPTDPNCPAAQCGYLLGNNPTGTVYVPPGTKVPYANESASTNASTFGVYLQDAWSPSSTVKVNAGLRLDGANFRLPQCDINTCLPTSTTIVAGKPVDRFDYDQATRTPRVLQPRLSVVDQFTPRDSLRVGYQRSVQFPLISQIDLTNNFAPVAYAPYANVPSFDVLSGAPAQFCGTTADRPCKSYADQLFWENEANFTGVPIQPLKPTTYTNWELSYAHQFPQNVAVKLTPFYRKAFDAVAQVAVPLVRNGQPLVNPATGAPVLGPPTDTNLGNSQIMGVEFLLTKEATYGLSGQLSLTYQNEFSNVIPTSPSEDFFPSVPLASIQLGNTYRVGFLSPLFGNLSLNYRTRNGWRINPTIYYDHGYPIGSGLLTAFNVNGKPYNLPNTNVTSPGQLSGSAGAPQYVDPQNPGSFFAPNVAASRGTPEAASPGGVLSHAEFAPVNLTVEYTPPAHKRYTFGALINNLFNNYYSNQPIINPRYQPVATGRGGPYSGYTSLGTNPAYIGAYNYIARNGALQYLNQASQVGRYVQFYVQFGF